MAANTRNSSSTEAGNDFSFSITDKVAGGAFLFGMGACALLRCISNCVNSDDSDNLDSRRVSSGRRTPSTSRPCDNGVGNGSPRDVESRECDVLHEESVKDAPVKIDDIHL